MFQSAFEVVLPTVSDIRQIIKYGNYPLRLWLAPAFIPPPALIASFGMISNR